MAVLGLTEPDRARSPLLLDLPGYSGTRSAVLIGERGQLVVGAPSTFTRSCGQSGWATKP